MRWSKRGIAAALAAAALGIVPAPATAANENAVCIGELISFIATTSDAGSVGAFASGNAHEWRGIGRVVGGEASSDTCG